MFLVNLHWSLVIIQIGHKGLSEKIILHFDSLDQGHDSGAIFGILKRCVEKSCVGISILLISFQDSDFT